MSTDTESVNGSAVHKSMSDSEVMISSIPKSSSQSQHRRILIDDISSCESSAGERVWATSSGSGDSSDVIRIHFVGDKFEEPALDVTRKQDLIMFTVPLLRFEKETDLQLRFRVGEDVNNITSIPFKYIPRIPRSASSDIVLFDNLVEFATNGDPISLLHPFKQLISNVNSEGNTVLHIASKSGQSFGLKLLLSILPEDKKAEILNLQNKHGLTALHCGIRSGDPDAVHYLMNHGARIDISDGYGNTALHYLGDAYNESIFKEILEPSRGQRFDINQLNSLGLAPIHVAVRKLKLSLIEMLIEAGALIDLLDKEKKRNALMHAIELNDFEAIQILVEKGSDPNIEDASNDTALSLAVKNVNYPIIGLLLDNGADPHRKNAKGTCLADSDDSVIQNIINGERPELPRKDAGLAIPNDLATSRSPLFGRSHPDQTPDEEAGRNRLVKRSREEILNDAQSLLDEVNTPKHSVISDHEESEEEGYHQQPGPSTSSGSSRRRRRDEFKWELTGKMSDNICNLDYLTRIRVSKIFDDQEKWQRLAQQLECDHMIELISICSCGDESSPTMIFLDQYEQLPDSSISKLRTAMSELAEEEGVKLIDQRYVY